MSKLVYIILVFLIGCSGSPIRTGEIAEKNVINISKIKKGMSKREVCNILRRAYKTEMISVGDKKYSIWYYITKRTYLYQSDLIDKNFTPLIFFENKLIGWGWSFYDYLFNIDNTREKVIQEKSQEYTDDEDEWPPNQHKIIVPGKKVPSEGGEAPSESDESSEPEEKVIEELKRNSNS